MTEVHEALRRWAKGLYPLEAGVELLIQAFGGRFANPSQPWVQQGDDPGWWWIDADQMNEGNYGALSGGETRLLRIAGSLLDGPPVDLSRNLAGLDREHLQLVLTAIAYASGGHDYDGPPVHELHGGYVDQRSGGLFPWPAQRLATRTGQ
ncbi:MAG: hypothetical protein WAV45_11070 [Propionibacteriaceae bacterium]